LTTIYPITYLFFLYQYKNRPAEEHLIWVGLIYLHLFLILLAFRGWETMGREKPNR